jgi:hypothetical protein
VAEVVLAMLLGALVLGLVSSVGGRLQRQLTRDANRLADDQQLATAAEVLPIDLRGLSPSSGDIAAGEARDSSLQVRATIANALACGGAPSTLLIAPYLGSSGSSSALSVQDGDTAWLLTDGDTSESWHPVRVRAVRRTSGSCAVLGDADAAKVFDISHLWAMDLRDSVIAAAGAVVRVTRPTRSSFYRAGDGRWYLGLRSWNSAAVLFNTIQPVSGPYAAATGAGGARFQYYDSVGNRVPSGAADTRSIARVEAVLLSERSSRDSSRDSLVVVIALRNRR